MGQKEQINNETLATLYASMVKIRWVENALMKVFADGEIPGFLHVCIGQEAAPAAICSLLNADDYIGSTHRGHGHALAKGVELKPFMAELFGRQDGFCLGRSGSMHLADKSVGLLGANGIVGGGLPIATGAAFAAKRKHPGRIAVAFFGDGATSQGTFHESLNMASLWRLPVIYVCENNGWAEFSPQAVHMAVTDIAAKAKPYGIPGVAVANDAIEIHDAAKAAVARARRGDGPTLIEVKSRRWHGHFVGDAQKYRGQGALTEAQEDDCLKKLEEVLLARGASTPDKMAEVQKKVSDEITAALAFARSSPRPQPAELAAGLYV